MAMNDFVFILLDLKYLKTYANEQNRLTACVAEDPYALAIVISTTF